MSIRRRPLTFRDPSHEVGETTHVPRHSIRQALAWTIAAEFARRHPGDCLVIETHPGGGQYDCVTVLTRASVEDSESEGGWRTIAQLNTERGGHVTHAGWFSGDAEAARFNWLEILLSEDIRQTVVEPLELAEDWPGPNETPRTTSASIGVWLLAAFAQRVALGRKPWVLLNGYVDTSGMGGGPRDDLFVQIPDVDADRRRRLPDDFLGIPEYRYWFLIEQRPDSDAGTVRLAVDTTAGTAFTAGGTVGLLTEYHNCGSKIDALVSATCPPAF